MTTKTCAVTLAMAAILGLGSGAFAQNMVGTQRINQADLAAVAEHCRTLAMGQDTPTADPASGNADYDATTTPPENSGTMDGAKPTTGNEGNVDDDWPDPATAPVGNGDTDAALTATTGLEGNVDADEFSGTINLNDITLADCKAAGM